MFNFLQVLWHWIIPYLPTNSDNNPQQWYIAQWNSWCISSLTWHCVDWDMVLKIEKLNMHTKTDIKCELNAILFASNLRNAGCQETCYTCCTCVMSVICSLTEHWQLFINTSTFALVCKQTFSCRSKVTLHYIFSDLIQMGRIISSKDRYSRITLQIGWWMAGERHIGQ